MRCILTITFLTGRLAITKKSSFRNFQLLCAFQLFILCKTALQRNFLDIQVPTFYDGFCQLAVISQLVPSLNFALEIIFSGLPLPQQAEMRPIYRRAILFEREKPNAQTSKPQQTQTMEQVKAGNIVQN